MSLAPALLIDTYTIQRTTQTLGTPITAFVPPKRGKRAKISFLQITSGSTAHTWYALKEKGRTTLAVAAAASATSLVLTKDPGLYSTNAEYASRSITPTVANNGVATTDYLLLQLNDSNFVLVKPSAVVTDSNTGRVTITVSSIGASGAPAGAVVWHMGAAADLDPHTGVVDQTILPPTSATTTYPSAAAVGGGTVCDAVLSYSPIVLYNANATAASVLDYGTAVYQDTGP